MNARQGNRRDRGSRGTGCFTDPDRAAAVRYGATVINTIWSDVPERVARLSAHAAASEVFGSQGHRWKLEPPMSAEELAELESQLRIELPAEYRSFLLEVSRGGAGPAYGLFALRRVDCRWEWEGDGADITDLETLAQPFPHTEAVNPADDLPAPVCVSGGPGGQRSGSWADVDRRHRIRRRVSASARRGRNPAGVRPVVPALAGAGDAVDIVARLNKESPVPLRSHGSLALNRALMPEEPHARQAHPEPDLPADLHS